MPSKTLSRSLSKIHSLAVQSAHDAVTVADLGEECVDQLRAVLQVIVGLSANNSLIHDLAKAGFETANRQHNWLDYSRGHVRKNLLRLTTAAGGVA